MPRLSIHLYVGISSVRTAADLVASMLEDGMFPPLLHEGLPMIRRAPSGEVFSIQRLADRIEVREAIGSALT